MGILALRRYSEGGGPGGMKYRDHAGRQFARVLNRELGNMALPRIPAITARRNKPAA